MGFLNIGFRRSRKKIWIFSAKPKKIWVFSAKQKKILICQSILQNFGIFQVLSLIRQHTLYFYKFNDICSIFHRFVSALIWSVDSIPLLELFVAFIKLVGASKTSIMVCVRIMTRPLFLVSRIMTTCWGDTNFRVGCVQLREHAQITFSSFRGSGPHPPEPRHRLRCPKSPNFRI